MASGGTTTRPAGKRPNARQGARTAGRSGATKTPAGKKASQRRASKGTPRRRSRWRWVRRLVLLTLTLTLLGALGLVGLFVYYGRDLPDVESLRDYQPPQTTRVLSRDGELIGESFVERRTVVPMERIPRHLVLCTLAAEDADFYRHEGFDALGLARAFARSVLTGRRPRGTSTITQQVVKLMLLSTEQTMERKVKELILSYRLEQALSKDEILHVYLNHINYGHGHYGVQEAARFYFDEDVEDLTLAQSSLIAGIPQSPARLSPRTHRENAERRQTYVLGQLRDKRIEYWPDLSEEAIDAAATEEVRIAPRPEHRELAPEVAAEVRRFLEELVGREAYARGGYTVHTTIDPAIQRQAREALRAGLQAVDERHHYRGPLRRPRRPGELEDATPRPGQTREAEVLRVDDASATITFDLGGQEASVDLSEAARYNPDGLSASAFAPEGSRARLEVVRVPDEGPVEALLELGPQGAVVVLDPASRDIVALVGGYEGGGFNRALQALRQPGSTFKPIVYAYGVHQGSFTPATLLVDAPAVYDRWNPQNYETWRHDGPIRLRPALARSINVVAVRAIETLGPENIAAFAHQLGIESELDPSLALALGASEVRPVELANAYATFAAGGRWEQPRLITRIEGPDGEEVRLPSRPPPRDVLTPDEAYVVTSLLTSVVTEGTARRGARNLGRPAGGKTGTTNEARDAWFVGYTPELVAAVWVGFDDRRPLGRRESGGRTALPIWVSLMRAATRGHPVRDFPRPSGVETARIDPESGLLAYEGQEDAIEEVFVGGSAPTEQARPPDVADTSTFLMEQFGQVGPDDTEGRETSPAQVEGDAAGAAAP